MWATHKQKFDMMGRSWRRRGCWAAGPCRTKLFRPSTHNSQFTPLLHHHHADVPDPPVGHDGPLCGGPPDGAHPEGPAPWRAEPHAPRPPVRWCQPRAVRAVLGGGWPRAAARGGRAGRLCGDPQHAAPPGHPGTGGPVASPPHPTPGAWPWERRARAASNRPACEEENYHFCD